VIARMAGRARYAAMLALRTRAPLVPLTATILAAIGVYAYPRSAVGETWGLTALLACALSAWVVGAVLAAEPAAQAEMSTVALGGRRGRAGLDATLVLLVALGQAAWFIGYPLVARRLGDPDVFVPPPQASDVFAATLAHVCCALAGGSLAVLFAPPRLARRASTVAAVTASLLAMVAVSGLLGALGGPVAVAAALTDARLHTITGRELTSCASCLVVAAALMVAGTRWAHVRG
jgi:hypothetical protein